MTDVLLPITAMEDCIRFQWPLQWVARMEVSSVLNRETETGQEEKLWISPK